MNEFYHQMAHVAFFLLGVVFCYRYLTYIPSPPSDEDEE